MGLYMGEDRSDFCEDNHDKNIITIIQGEQGLWNYAREIIILIFFRIKITMIMNIIITIIVIRGEQGLWGYAWEKIILFF